MALPNYTRTKRILDTVFAAVLLFLLAPVFALASVLISLIDGRPVLFRQLRPGLGGKLFWIIKFRTMGEVEEPDFIGVRSTTLGKILRRFSIDEAPQLLNILRGDMSFVGPRPLLADYLPLYSPRQAIRHNVRPGLTGLAQVSGRNQLGWEERFELDVAYVEHQSFLLDTKILRRTLFVTATGRGVRAPNSETVAPFRG
jgi:sugar transferase EpsL